MKITNVTELMEHALATLEKLENGEIDCQQARVHGKMYETVIGAVNTQIKYAYLNNLVPRIEFIEQGSAYVAPQISNIKIAQLGN